MKKIRGQNAAITSAKEARRKASGAVHPSRGREPPSSCFVVSQRGSGRNQSTRRSVFAESTDGDKGNNDLERHLRERENRRENVFPHCSLL